MFDLVWLDLDQAKSSLVKSRLDLTYSEAWAKKEKEVKEKKEKESKVKQEAYSCYSYSCTVKAWVFAASLEAQAADGLDEVLRILNLLLIMTFETSAR